MLNLRRIMFMAASLAVWSGTALSQPEDRATSSPQTTNPLAHWQDLAAQQDRSLCVLTPDPDGGDDAPAFLEVFNKICRRRSIIVLPGPLYHINSPMKTTDMDDVVIDQQGTLLWSNDTSYWLSVSMPVGFQNQSTVWHFGGDNVVWDGHGVGTFDGNGQAWYDLNHGGSNMAHRPMNINFLHLTNSVMRGMRFVQSQMWTMNIMYSKNLVFEDIYVNSTSSNQNNALNTDGADTEYSDNITFRRWKVICGDDAIAAKGNSSNIFIYDSEFWHATGIAVGSIGQYLGQYEYVENFYMKNVTLHDTSRALYFKTWTGRQIGYPPNGGGGGTGHARNIVMEDITLNHTREEPFFITQCESYSGHGGEECDTSTFKIEDVTWRNVRGTTNSGVSRLAYFRCSAGAGGCSNFTAEGIHITPIGKADELTTWHCENVSGTHGFSCDCLCSSNMVGSEL